MAKIKISKKEIEKMLKDQLDCKDVKWDNEGNANVELDLAEIKEKEKVFIPYTYPIYIDRTPSKPFPYPYWSANSTDGTINYCSMK